MKDISEAFGIGIEEYLDNAYLSIIEWPEIYEEELEGLQFHQISIENIEGIRHISFETFS